MFFYEHNNNFFISNKSYSEFNKVDEQYCKNSDTLYALNKLSPVSSRRSFSVQDGAFMFIEKEDLNILEKPLALLTEIPEWVKAKIANRCVKAINIEYGNWQQSLSVLESKKWNVNIAGLGDVGSTLITGLRMSGDDCINQIGIYDLDKNKINRMLFEGNQIYEAFSEKAFPEIIELSEEDIFNCDMFVFCVTAGVPPIGTPHGDVRMIQYENNKKIITHYAKLARKSHFNGIFAVVSDPVDQLCKAALIASNTNATGIYDNQGLVPEQIQGYGLGVMNARAVYYSKQNNLAPYYEKSGRAFGPHGEGLVIADSIDDYNNDISLLLTEKAKTANLKVRDTGFKPYIAPALSSGSLSLLNTIRGKWHYSSTYMGNAFIGAKNRFNNTGLEVEQIKLNFELKCRLSTTYERLCDY